MATQIFVSQRGRRVQKQVRFDNFIEIEGEESREDEDIVRTPHQDI